MPFFGRKTGFNNLRDAVLFFAGLGGLGYSLFNGKVSSTLITVFAGLLVSPAVLHTDERRTTEEEKQPPPAKRAPAKRAGTRTTSGKRK